MPPILGVVRVDTRRGRSAGPSALAGAVASTAYADQHVDRLPGPRCTTCLGFTRIDADLDG